MERQQLTQNPPGYTLSSPPKNDRGAPGVAADVSHIDTPGEVSVPLLVRPAPTE